jgi:hypothetical protein
MRHNSSWRQVNRLGSDKAKIFASAPIIPTSKKNSKSVLITGGIGDFLAIEPFFFAKDQEIKTVFLATRGHFEIAKLILKRYKEISIKNLLPIFPKDLYCFTTKSQLLQYMKSRNIFYPAEFEKSQDYSIFRMFPQIHNDTAKLSTSRYMEETLCELKEFNLPANYVALVGNSLRDTRTAATGRNFTNEEYENCLKCIRMPIICVYCQCANPHPAIMHLKETNILQSIEIVKQSKGYVGIDSWLSVIAGQCLPAEKVKIKCINQNGITNKKCYWPKIWQNEILYNNLLNEFKWTTST